MSRRTHDIEENREQSGTRRRRKRRSFRGLLILAGLLALVFFLPSIVTSRPVLTRAIDYFAGIKPLRVDFSDVRAGWLTPVGVSGLRLLDGEGKELAKVGDVQTEKGLIGWITNSSDLGNISVSGIESVIVASDGSTNLEQALEPLLKSVELNPNEPVDSGASVTTGTIEIVNSKIMLLEAGRPEQWLVELAKVHVALPNADQVVGPIDVQVKIGDASGTVANSQGLIVADVKQGASSAFEVRAKIENVPLDFWHVVHARLPEIPIEELRGRMSAVMAGSVVDDQAWSFDFRELQAADLSIIAPELVGDEPAELRLIAGAAKCSLANAVMRLENTQLSCDFASATAQANIPWPIEAPTAAKPFLKGAVFDAKGSVDLPKLVAAAKSLIPIREDMQLLAGTADFDVNQDALKASGPHAGAKLTLSGLRAVNAGQPMSWNDPLSVEMMVDEEDARLKFQVAAATEFANLAGGGTIESGEIRGDVDLSLLRERLSQWVDLPMVTMVGSANIDAQWDLQDDETVVAKGNLHTTSVSIATTAGNQLEEPAWAGEFEGRMKLAGGSPQSIEQASLTLNSRDEQLLVNLQQPLYLVEAAADQTPYPPAAFNVDVHADLANCNRRASVWLSEPPEVQVAGKLQMAASGLIDTTHVEILSANWNGQPIQVTTPQLSFSEPRVVGKFKGRVDTNDLTRMVIETLEMTSSSVSLLAQDQANPDGSGSRVGRAKFLMDLGRLMNSTTAAVANAAPTAETKITATGRCEGELAWQMSSTAAGVNVLATASNLVVLSQSPGQIAPQPIWQEQQATANVSGTWVAETGAIDVQAMKLEMPWLNYAGTAKYTINGSDQAANLNGQVVYDSEQLTQKLTPFTGGQLLLAGQQTVPIQVEWSQAAEQASMLAGLNAATRIGWEQAAVAGILVGKADVPITVDAGVLKTAAEIPVSGGFVRWDLETDLGADEMVLYQKPMTMLETVEITEEMCKGWLKYVTPLIAEATSVDGRMSLQVEQAKLSPANPAKQTVVGQLVIHNATVGPGPLSNQVIGLAKQINAIRKRDLTQAVSSTQRVWMEVPEQRVDFEMIDGRVSHRNLNVDIGDVTISSQGSVSVEGNLNMVAAMPIPDDWADKSPWLASLRGQTLQFPIGGTLQKPQLDTQLLRQLGTQTLQNAAGGLLQQGLNRGLDKILGGSGQPNAGQQPAAPASENPVLDLGGQILRGQGINLPGLFGGGRSSGKSDQN